MVGIPVVLTAFGPEARLPTGRRAWSVVRGFDAGLLDGAKADLLRMLDERSGSWLSAVRGLGFFDDAGVRERLQRLFRESSGPERTVVLEALARAGDRETLLQVLQDRRFHPSLLLKAVQIVSELKVREAVGPLVDLLESPDASIRLGAFVALLQLTRIHFDYDPNGPEEERARSVENWRYWLKMQETDR